MVIPTPIETINELNKLPFNFLWDEKPDKISRDRACTTQLNGGLKMINIHKFEMSEIKMGKTNLHWELKGLV